MGIQGRYWISKKAALVPTIRLGAACSIATLTNRMHPLAEPSVNPRGLRFEQGVEKCEIEGTSQIGRFDLDAQRGRPHYGCSSCGSGLSLQQVKKRLSPLRSCLRKRRHPHLRGRPQSIQAFPRRPCLPIHHRRCFHTSRTRDSGFPVRRTSFFRRTRPFMQPTAEKTAWIPFMKRPHLGFSPSIPEYG